MQVRTGATLRVMLLAFVQMSCSGATDDAKTSPVSSAPLSGTIAGTPFSAKGSFTRPFSAAEPTLKVFYIFDVDADCKTAQKVLQDRQLKGLRDLQIIAPWPLDPTPSGQEVAGATVSIEVSTPGSLKSEGASGRVEIVSATSSVAVLRVRAKASNNSLEGEVSVNICP